MTVRDRGWLTEWSIRTSPVEVSGGARTHAVDRDRGVVVDPHDGFAVEVVAGLGWEAPGRGGAFGRGEARDALGRARGGLVAGGQAQQRGRVTGQVAVGTTVERGTIPRADVAEIIATAITEGTAVRTQFEAVSGDVPVSDALATIKY